MALAPPAKGLESLRDSDFLVQVLTGLSEVHETMGVLTKAQGEAQVGGSPFFPLLLPVLVFQLVASESKRGYYSVNSYTFLPNAIFKEEEQEGGFCCCNWVLGRPGRLLAHCILYDDLGFLMLLSSSPRGWD